MIEVKVQSLGIDQATKSPVVILQEVDGERMLPIWIGAGEASAIAMELTGMKFTRPLTHDLAAAIVREMGGTLARVTISRVQNNTYFAEMQIQQGQRLVTVDARPSDSIAIALRLQARLYTSEELLADTSIQFSADSAEQAPPTAEPPAASAEELQARLKKLNPEDLGRFTP